MAINSTEYPYNYHWYLFRKLNNKPEAMKAYRTMCENAYRYGGADALTQKEQTKHWIVIAEQVLNQYNIPYEDRKESTMTNDELYRILPKGNRKEDFGKCVGTDSKGRLIIETKTGIAAYSKDDLEVVMPYTVTIQFTRDGAHYSYFATEGELEEGELFIITTHSVVSDVHGRFAKAIKINTKSKAATKWLEGYKLGGTPLTVGEND
jgi:hypothetical protein